MMCYAAVLLRKSACVMFMVLVMLVGRNFEWCGGKVMALWERSWVSELGYSRCIWCIGVESSWLSVPRLKR